MGNTVKALRIKGNEFIWPVNIKHDFLGEMPFGIKKIMQPVFSHSFEPAT